MLMCHAMSTTLMTREHDTSVNFCYFMSHISSLVTCEYAMSPYHINNLIARKCAMLMDNYYINTLLHTIIAFDKDNLTLKRLLTFRTEWGILKLLEVARKFLELIIYIYIYRFYSPGIL